MTILYSDHAIFIGSLNSHGMILIFTISLDMYYSIHEVYFTTSPNSITSSHFLFIQHHMFYMYSTIYTAQDYVFMGGTVHLSTRLKE